MEKDRHIYRLRSTPDIVLKLGSFPVEQLLSINNSLHVQRDRIDMDIGQLQAEIEGRHIVVDAESLLSEDEQVEASLARTREACEADEAERLGQLVLLPQPEPPVPPSAA